MPARLSDSQSFEIDRNAVLLDMLYGIEILLVRFLTKKVYLLNSEGILAKA